MPKITTKQELINYFAEKSQRAYEGNAYIETVVSILMLLDETDNIQEIKSTVRAMNREEVGRDTAYRRYRNTHRATQAVSCL